MLIDFFLALKLFAATIAGKPKLLRCFKSGNTLATDFRLDIGVKLTP